MDHGQSDEQTKIPLSENNHVKPERIVVFGVNGDLGGKLSEFYRHATRMGGVEVYGVDIVPEDEFKPEFTGFKAYYNIHDWAAKEEFFKIGQAQPFDLGYDGAWPSVRIFNLCQFHRLCRYMISTKPVVPIKHYATFESLVGFDAAIEDPDQQALMGVHGYEDLIAKTAGHDHYLNKPAVSAVLNNLSKLHSQFGRFFRVTIFITEQRDVNHKEEQKRIRALDEGMIPDLDTHGVMFIQRLTPVGLIWQDSGGNYIKRQWRRILPIACVRAQMKNAMCESDTACIAEYEVQEKLIIVDDQEGTPRKGAVLRPSSFHVLVVCGKGFRVENYTDRDLKAIEIAFQGQGQSTGIIDLGTNQVNQMLASVLGPDVPGPELRVHGGINLPMTVLADNWQDFSSPRSSIRERDFQSVNLLFENMTLLKGTMELTRSTGFPAYDSQELVHHFLSTHVKAGNGFRFFSERGSESHTAEAPMHLMLGRPPEMRIF
ncbi:MAG: hypothetical protein AAB533_02345 [Patescibacteria group bacterium]